MKGQAKKFTTSNSALKELLNGTRDIMPQGKNGTLVIKKNLGADSLKKYLISVFGNCEIWERDKGYYILHSVKN